MRRVVNMRGAAFLLLFGIFLTAGCASQRASGGAAPQAPRDVVEAHGEGATLGEALSAAKVDAIRQGVIVLLGPEVEQAHRARLEEVLYRTSNPNAFLHMETLETLRKENVGSIDEPRYVYDLRVRVKLDAIEQVLDANGIPGGSGAPTAEAPQPSTGEVQGTASGGAGLTPEEQRFLEQYLERLTYMVYFSEESKEDPFLMKSAVSMANSYLASQGFSLIDIDQIERLKEEQRMVYEEETGEAVSIIQWIAQRLNADVYLEIDAVTEGETKGENHYGSAKVTVKIFDPSTGALLGSVPYSSPRTFSRVSQFDAVSNALQSTIYKAMPVAVGQAKQLLARAYSRGIRYDLVLEGTPDARVVAAFRAALRKKERVKDIQTVYQTREETKFAVYFLGRTEELEELVYEVAETVAGLEYLEPVLIRGKSLTFNTGLE